MTSSKEVASLCRKAKNRCKFGQIYHAEQSLREAFSIAVTDDDFDACNKCYDFIYSGVSDEKAVNSTRR